MIVLKNKTITANNEIDGVKKYSIGDEIPDGAIEKKRLERLIEKGDIGNPGKLKNEAPPSAPKKDSKEILELKKENKALLKKIEALTAALQKIEDEKQIVKEGGGK